MTWTVILSRQAVKNARKLSQAGLKTKAESLLKMLQQDPLQTPTSFERLVGNLGGFYSRRINIQHRLVYRIDLKQKIVHALRMWTYDK